MTSIPIPPPYVEGPLVEYWNRPVSELVAVQLSALDPAQRERHRLYSLVAMALGFRYWNGNKRGPDGEYPWRLSQRLPNATYAGGDYLGHNIVAVAVDGYGRIVDFDFNHNQIFSSSVEHAESRLIRRVFSLVQLRDDWRPKVMLLGQIAPGPRPYSTVLRDVTIYTTLESCAQCAGIMTLGQVYQTVYLQRDPGMYLIGNILRNLTQPGLRAPLPIPGNAFGLEYFEQLNEAFQCFVTHVKEKPFHISTEGHKDFSSSMTSFLCTDEARKIFGAAHDELYTFTPKYGDFRPAASVTLPDGDVLSNEEVLTHLQRFLEYAVTKGQRGTPHKL